MNRETQQLATLSDTIRHARIGLVTELVEVFNIVEVGGRPPIGGKAGTKGEWTIGDLVLPVPGDIRRNVCFPHFPYRLSDVFNHRIPSRPYERRHNTYHSLLRASNVLSRHQAAF